MALSRSGQHDSAIFYLEKALLINSKYADACSNLAICYIQKNKRKRPYHIL